VVLEHARVVIRDRERTHRADLRQTRLWLLTSAPQRPLHCERMRARACQGCVRACVCARQCVCVRARVCARVSVCASVCANSMGATSNELFTPGWSMSWHSAATAIAVQQHNRNNARQTDRNNVTRRQASAPSIARTSLESSHVERSVWRRKRYATCVTVNACCPVHTSEHARVHA
jgi:hypothetical protein